jgi:hypothetical protein
MRQRLILWFHCAKNSENTWMPPKQALINSNIKDNVVIKLCKKSWNLKKS